MESSGWRGLAGAAAVLLLVACTPAPAPQVGAAAPTSDLPSAAARAAHTMTPLRDGSLLVAGGCVVDGCATATASAVVVSATGDRAVAPMATARDAHTATLLRDGRVLVTGGFTGEGVRPLRSAEVFDPVDGSWAIVGPMRVGRGGHAAALLGDGRVLVAGGWVSSHVYTATTEIFDPRTGRFTRGPDLPRAVDGLAAVSLGNGSVLVAGGQRSPGRATRQAVTIDSGGRLRVLPGLRRARFKHALVRLPSGRVLAIGGTPDDSDLLASSEVFDPATGRFRAGPRLHDGRYKLSGAAVLLPDGRVAVAGGGPGVEVVDVRRGQVTTVAAAGREVASFSTLGIVGGALLVLGGYDDRIRLTHTRLSIALSEL